jgi:molecular chaperone DnaK (HSP70)
VILDEAIACAKAYRTSIDNGYVVVYDHSRDRLKISLLEKHDDHYNCKIAVEDESLGGKHFINAIVQYICDDYHKVYNRDLRQDVPLRLLYKRCEVAMNELSSQALTKIFLSDDIAYTPKITRAKFERLNVERLKQCTDLVLTVVSSEQSLSIDHVTSIILAGGLSLMPVISRSMKQLSSHVKIHDSIHPQEVMALGAAYHLYKLEYIPFPTHIDVTDVTIGIETANGIIAPLLHRNSTLPCTRSLTFTVLCDLQDSAVIKVFTGERPLSTHCVHVHTFNFNCVTIAAKGISEILVVIDVDANRNVVFTIKDLASNKTLHFTDNRDITYCHARVMDQMITEAIQMQEHDQHYRNQVVLELPSQPSREKRVRIRDFFSDVDFWFKKFEVCYPLTTDQF